MIARALVGGPRHLVVRDVDRGLKVDEVRELLAMLHSLADRRLIVLASVEDAVSALPFATRRDRRRLTRDTEGAARARSAHQDEAPEATRLADL
jgi:hypothetical protein